MQILGIIQVNFLSLLRGEYASSCGIVQDCHTANTLSTPQVKSEVMEIVGNIASIQGIIGVSIGSVAARVLREHFPSAESLLESCSKDLGKIKTRFSEINTDRRELIHAAVERGDCKSLESLEDDLRRYGLSHRLYPYLTFIFSVC